MAWSRNLTVFAAQLLLLQVARLELEVGCESIPLAQNRQISLHNCCCRRPGRSWRWSGRLRGWSGRLPPARAWATCPAWRPPSWRRASWGHRACTRRRTGDWSGGWQNQMHVGRLESSGHAPGGIQVALGVQLRAMTVYSALLGCRAQPECRTCAQGAGEGSSLLTCNPLFVPVVCAGRRRTCEAGLRPRPALAPPWTQPCAICRRWGARRTLTQVRPQSAQRLLCALCSQHKMSACAAGNPPFESSSFVSRACHPRPAHYVDSTAYCAWGRAGQAVPSRTVGPPTPHPPFSTTPAHLVNSHLRPCELQPLPPSHLTPSPIPTPPISPPPLTPACALPAPPSPPSQWSALLRRRAPAGTCWPQSAPARARRCTAGAPRPPARLSWSARCARAPAQRSCRA